MQSLPLLKKLIDLIKKYSTNKRIFREQLNGNIALQIALSATQIPGDIFLECKRISVRDRYGGTS